MSDRAVKNTRDLRRQHNQELIRRMRNGESLTAFDSKASWYPPRPIIEKDKVAIEKLYHDNSKFARQTPDRSTQPSKHAFSTMSVVRRNYDEAG